MGLAHWRFVVLFILILILITVLTEEFAIGAFSSAKETNDLFTPIALLNTPITEVVRIKSGGVTRAFHLHALCTDKSLAILATQGT
jgi:hypothetical protein